MKAVAVFPASKQISLVDHEQPSLASPTEAKLRMLEVGICGADREICRFDYGIPPAGEIARWRPLEKMFHATHFAYHIVQR